MDINVTIDNVTTNDRNMVHKGEYNVVENKLKFTFSDEYDGLTKMAVFSSPFVSLPVKVDIIDNECYIPFEVLGENYVPLTIGVYGYRSENDTLITQYSPCPLEIMISCGSYEKNTTDSEVMTPSQYDLYSETAQRLLEEKENELEQYVDENIPTISVGETTTGEAGTNANVTENVSGINHEFSFTIPRGDKGDIGITPNIQIGTVTTLETGESATATISGTILNPLLNLGLPKGNTGEPGAIKFRIVNELPTQDIETDAIYLVPLETPTEEGNNYAEYMYVNGNWELLGKIGVHVDLSDYYTKQETNGLLNSKVDTTRKINNKPLTSDVTLSASDVGAIPSTTPVEVTTNKVTSVSSSSTDTQYPSAKLLYDSQKAQDDRIEAIEDLFEGDSTITGIGKEITLNDTLKGQLKDIKIKGNTNQEGTPTPDAPIDIEVVTGNNEVVVENKNLFDKDNANILNAYFNGTSTTKLTSSNSIRTLYVKAQPNTTYTTQIRTGGATTDTLGYTYELPTLNTQVYGITNNRTITTDSNAKYLVYRFYDNGGSATITLEEALNSIQIEKGTSASSYVPHESETYEINLGNIELCKIGTYQDKIDKSTGKNLLNITNGTETLNNYYYTPHPLDFTITQDMVGKKMSYSFDLNVSSITTSATQVYAMIGYGVSSLTNIIKQYNFSNITIGKYNIKIEDFEITSDMVGKNLYTRYLGFNTQSIATYSYLNVQLEYGSLSTSYEPYGTGWYLKKEIGKVVLDGSENWSNFTTLSGGTISQVRLVNTNSGTRDGLSNKFKVEANYNATEHIVFGGDNTTLYIHIANNRLSTLDISGFNTWLSNNNTTVYYILATPTYETITDTTLISQLNALYKAKTYKGQTNISSETENEQMILDVTAFKDNLNGRFDYYDTMIERLGE